MSECDLLFNSQYHFLFSFQGSPFLENGVTHLLSVVSVCMFVCMHACVCLWTVRVVIPALMGGN